MIRESEQWIARRSKEAHMAEITRATTGRNGKSDREQRHQSAGGQMEDNLHFPVKRHMTEGENSYETDM
jgi:hypothetical protein